MRYPRPYILIQLLVLAILLGLATRRVPPSDASLDFAHVRKQRATVDLTADERRWEEIGWLDDVTRALVLSQEVRRPTLIVGHIGELDGRC